MNGSLKIIICFLLFFPSGYLAKPQNKNEQKVIVRALNGDNLWNLARRIYGNGFDYPKLWAGRLDSKLSNDPNLIFPNMEFIISQVSTSTIDSTISFQSMPGYNIKNDILKIRDATISIDDNIKKLTTPQETHWFSRTLTFIFNELFLVILTGVITAIIAYNILPKNKSNSVDSQQL